MDTLMFNPPRRVGLHLCFTPAAPGVIHIKPLLGFREKYNSDYKLRILLEYFGQMWFESV